MTPLRSSPPAHSAFSPYAAALLLLVMIAGKGSDAIAQAQDRPSDYTFQATLETSGQGPWYRVQLPVNAQMAARYADLRDLRIFNRAGEALPYAIEAGAEQHTQTRRETAVKLFPLRSPAATPEAPPSLRVQRTATGTLIELSAPAEPAETPQDRLRGWLLDASAVTYPLERLSFGWSSADEGFQRFSIEASDDLSTWRAWGEGQIARFSFNGEHIDQNEIRLPGKKARYLRLMWLSPDTAPALSSARLHGSLNQVEPAPLIWSAPLPGQRSAEGEFIWNLPLALPLERVRVTLDQPNTLAPVALSGRSTTTPDKNRRPPYWIPLARGVLYRLPLHGEETVQDELVLPGVAIHQLRLQVDPRGGGLGNQPPALRVSLRRNDVIFLARGDGPYTLALGRDNAPAASLPLTTLIPGYRTGSPIGSAQLGGAPDAGGTRITPPAPPLPSSTPQQDWKKISLWAILLLGVSLLGWMAASLLRTSSTHKEKADTAENGEQENAHKPGGLSR